MKMNIRKRILMVHSKNAIVLYLRANQRHWNQVSPGSANKVIKVLALHCKPEKTGREASQAPQETPESGEDPQTQRIFQRHSRYTTIRRNAPICQRARVTRATTSACSKPRLCRRKCGRPIRKRLCLRLKQTSPGC